MEWGGEAFGPPGSTTPPMGGGYYPIGTTKFDAYFSLVSVLNEYGQTVDVDNTEEFSDNNKLYKVVDRGNVGGQYGHYFVYGGPGGKSTQV